MTNKEKRRRLDRGIDGGYTRVCANCESKWATNLSPVADEAPGPCPECGYTNAEGEQTYDWSTCPGCGKENISKRNAPVSGFPGQRYCSAKCAGVI